MKNTQSQWRQSNVLEDWMPSTRKLWYWLSLVEWVSICPHKREVYLSSRGTECESYQTHSVLVRLLVVSGRPKYLIGNWSTGLPSSVTVLWRPRSVGPAINIEDFLMLISNPNSISNSFRTIAIPPREEAVPSVKTSRSSPKLRYVILKSNLFYYLILNFNWEYEF